MDEEHFIVALVEDRPGVMQRIAGMLRRRNFNIDSISVGTTEIPGISRITMTVHGDRLTLEQAMKQLNKLIEVVKVSELRQEESVVRELALVKVSVKNERARAEVVQYANIFRARIVDVSRQSMMIEITGDEEKLRAFIELMRSYGIIEIARTGKVIMARGAKSVKTREAK
ncbi:MAG: acetolactate synthase small subunit [Euryarchaeota archaeon]|nr:acetolactate synthase small subunit [Euryarchaeota archaeon]